MAHWSVKLQLDPMNLLEMQEDDNLVRLKANTPHSMIVILGDAKNLTSGLFDLRP
jgi:hypothetical protein